MKLNELVKRIIDTCNYNEMCVDTEMTIEYVCDIVEPLATKDTLKITELVIFPMMDQYRASEDVDEMVYIQETIRNIYEWTAV